MKTRKIPTIRGLICLPILAAFSVSSKVQAQTEEGSPFHVRHVLVISIDGAHALDLANYIKAKPQSALGQLADTAVIYTNANIPTPADNHEGTLAVFTGGTPVTTGVYFDEIYDRSLCAPDSKTLGTEVIFAHEMDVDSSRLDGGGGIDPKKLARDPKRGYQPVYPHNFIRVNTAFEVAKAAGMRTAWTDKHFNEDFLNGPSGSGVDDLFVREINYEPTGTHGMTNKVNQTIRLTEPLDDQKVQALINEIDGFDHERKERVGVPGLFGVTLQAVTVGEMQPAYENNADGQKAQEGGGYADAAGTFSPVLQEGWDHTDKLIGSVLAELKAQKLLASTLIILTGMHGQTPMEVKRRHLVDEAVIPKLIGADLAKATYDDIDLIWLKDQSRTAQVADMLTQPENEAKASIQTVLWGESLKLMFPDPLEDSRVPDIIVIPNFGVMYGKSTSVYRAEHGGFTHEDTNVPLLLSHPALTRKVIKSVLSTTEVAPTILKVLGLDPNALEAVRAEYTRVLPGFFPSS